MRETTLVQAWWPRMGAVAAGICLMAAAGCQGSISKGDNNGTGNTNGGAGNTGTAGGTGTGSQCTGSMTLAPQRIVRLTLQEIANSAAAIDPSLTQTLVTQQGLGQPTLAFFHAARAARARATPSSPTATSRPTTWPSPLSQFVSGELYGDHEVRTGEPTTPAGKTTSSLSSR